jgi:hypothetical protein
LRDLVHRLAFLVGEGIREGDRALRFDPEALALDGAEWTGSETEGYNVSFSESKLRADFAPMRRRCR